jgi:dTDP-4-amino-4,6-dideoxygalactose transaminase
MKTKPASAKKSVSDFRYNSGAARVPWAAVGEPVREQDVAQIVRFLLRPKQQKSPAYERQFAKVERELLKLKHVADYAGKLTLGNSVAQLEQQCNRLLGTQHALFLTSWTAGAEIIYKYAGLKAGDEVIAPALTFIATIAYPLAVGAKVVLADVDPRTLNLDPADVARKITPRTKVIVPVHLGGYPCDMDAILKLARRHNITVFEDAAHAFGASYKGRMCGSIGDFGAFSFHEVKNVTSLGEGGILCTNLPFGAQLPKARFLGLDFSRQIPNWLYDVTAVEGKTGWFAAGNHSTTEIQAIGLMQQMARLKGIIAKRRRAAHYLNRRLAKVPGLVTPPLDDRQITSSHHLYLLQVDPDQLGADVQAFKHKLAERGLVQIPHFAPLYKFSVMRQLGYDTAALEASCPVAEEAFQHRFTHLPLYDYDAGQLKFMADMIIDAAAELRAGR